MESRVGDFMVAKITTSLIGLFHCCFGHIYTTSKKKSKPNKYTNLKTNFFLNPGK